MEEETWEDELDERLLSGSGSECGNLLDFFESLRGRTDWDALEKEYGYEMDLYYEGVES